MKQIHPKALSCFETRTMLHHITWNNSVLLNHGVLALSDFIKTSFKFLLCLLTEGERTIWSWLWSLQCQLPPKPSKFQRCDKTSQSSFPCKEDTATASWSFVDREAGIKWGLKDKKARAAFKIYCIPWAMNAFAQEQPSTAISFPIELQPQRNSSLQQLDTSSVPGCQGARIPLKLAGDEGTVYVSGSAVCWAFNTHSSCDEEGETPWAQSKAWGQLAFYHIQLASGPALCNEKFKTLKMPPAWASVQSCTAAGGQRGCDDFCMFCPKKSARKGAGTHTWVKKGGKMHCITQWFITFLMWELALHSNTKTNQQNIQAWN